MFTKSSRIALSAGALMAAAIITSWAGTASANTMALSQGNTFANLSTFGTLLASNNPSSIAGSYGTLNYYVGNKPQLPGETFTTGASASTITAVAVYFNGSYGLGGIDLYIGTATKGTANTVGNYTLTNEYSGTFTGTSTVGYAVFTLGTPLTVLPNTQYIYALYGVEQQLGLGTTGGTSSQQLALLTAGVPTLPSTNTTGTYNTYTGTSSGGTNTSTSGLPNDSGTDNAAFAVIGSVPEPATLGMLAVGSLGLLLVGRKRENRLPRG